MRILIVGARLHTSIGYGLQQLLPEHDVILASKSGGDDVMKCDISDRDDLVECLANVQPDAVIMTAGIYPDPMPFGQIEDWQMVAQLVRTKILGAIVLLDAVVRSNVGFVIIVGGVDISSDPHYAIFSAINSGLRNAIAFASRHTSLQAFYVRVGLVADTTMGQAHLEHLDPETARAHLEKAVTVQDIVLGIRGIFSGVHKSGDAIDVFREAI